MLYVASVRLSAGWYPRVAKLLTADSSLPYGRSWCWVIGVSSCAMDWLFAEFWTVAPPLYYLQFLSLCMIVSVCVCLSLRHNRDGYFVLMIKFAVCLCAPEVMLERPSDVCVCVLGWLVGYVLFKGMLQGLGSESGCLLLYMETTSSGDAPHKM